MGPEGEALAAEVAAGVEAGGGADGAGADGAATGAAALTGADGFACVCVGSMGNLLPQVRKEDRGPCCSFQYERDLGIRAGRKQGTVIKR
jgi:hypothetical protein